MISDISVEADADDVGSADFPAGALPETAGDEPTTDIHRALEAILLVADEPQGLVHLATALGRPVAETAAAVTRLVNDYDGRGENGRKRGESAQRIGARAAERVHQQRSLSKADCKDSALVDAVARRELDQ